MSGLNTPITLSFGRKAVPAEVGLPPRASLLPPEVGERKHAKAVRRRAIFAVITVAAVTAVAIAGIHAFAFTRTLALESAQADTLAILQQQTEYSEVRAADAAINAIEDGRRYATSTEIDWAKFFTSIVAKLPAGVRVSDYRAESGSPMTPLTTTNVPLRNPYVATYVVQVVSPDVPAIDAWVRDLPTVPGIAGAVLQSTSWDEGQGGYTGTVGLFLDGTALARRFEPVTEEADTDSDTTTETSTP